MFNKRIIAVVSVLALTLIAFSASQVIAKSGCTLRDSGCTADDISFSVWTGTPTTPCPQGETVYLFSATITCGIGLGDPVSDQVCATSSNSISFSLNGQIHTFQPVSGSTWQDVVDDCQSNLTYSVN